MRQSPATTILESYSLCAVVTVTGATANTCEKKRVIIVLLLGLFVAIRYRSSDRR